MTSLTYIHHDCFFYRTVTPGGEPLAVIFDYWRDPEDRLLSLLPEDCRIYVLVSHFHKDHYNPAIFGWSARFGDRVRYVISRDTARHARHILRPESLYKGVKPDPATVAVISKGEKYEDEYLTVHAFGSTDIGNSYVVEVKGGDIVMHAGDLNFWAWRDESTPEEVESARKAFLSELRPIAEKFPAIDYAMFPVDSRIGTGYWEGASILLRSISVARFFPMHFELADDEAALAQRHRDALRFDLYASGSGEYIGLTAPYSIFAR